MKKKFELGITSFTETTPDPNTGETISHAERIRQEIERIVLADKIGLDVYGVGEHHRPDFAASAPAIILAAAAARTKNIRLTTAVTVLSSEDPVRVFQQFSTIDAISNGRAEIMAGRGSFTESFPLFGYDLKDYHVLFEEKLHLLLHIRDNEIANWSGYIRPTIDNIGIYPRPVQKKLPISIAVGGTPESVIRAGKLGLPIVFAIIGGNPIFFKPLVELYKRTAIEHGHNLDELSIGVHSHGFVWEDSEEGADLFFPSTAHVMNKLGKERGWRPYGREEFDQARSMDGALFVGDPEYVAEKILLMRKNLGIDRFMLHVPLGSMPHEQVMKAIELFGTKVAPIVRKKIEEEQN